MNNKQLKLEILNTVHEIHAKDTYIKGIDMESLSIKKQERMDNAMNRCFTDLKLLLDIWIKAKSNVAVEPKAETKLIKAEAESNTDTEEIDQPVRPKNRHQVNLVAELEEEIILPKKKKRILEEDL